ncbi:MAG: immunity 17 family protein [Parabacteroides sp.]|nr:immunity 17 family protein [Parabacteroides sp.]MCI7008923.1 immunity 17 family protein [Parabacteroides sp.]MDD6080270.1 immunity 17 family protein [bacterium]MDD7061839.1 immunity 17 family protein [bacterium]MDY4756905.1 immunity 17 family protein [Parabacteroides sp.]
MTPSEYFIFALFIGLGVFSVVAAVLDLEWYFQTSAAQTFVRWLGRTGARLFYVLLGIGLISCGVLAILYY